MRRWTWMCLVGLSGLSCAAGAAGAAEESPDGGVKQKPKKDAFDLLKTPGVIVGDWNLEVTLTTGTDGSQDTPRSSERARQRDNDQREAQHLSQKQPNPLVDTIRQHLYEPVASPQDPGFGVAATAHRELQQHQPPSTIIDPLSGRPVMVTTGPGDQAPDVRKRVATSRRALHKRTRRMAAPPMTPP